MTATLPKQPLSLQCAIVCLLIAMILEIIGLGIQAVRGAFGSFSIISAHAFMAITTWATVKYLIDIEKRHVNSLIGVLSSIAANILALLVLIRMELFNPAFYLALLFDGLGSIFLLLPSSMYWLQKSKGGRIVH